MLSLLRDPLGALAASALGDLWGASVLVSLPLLLLLGGLVTLQRFFGRLFQIYSVGFTIIGCYASAQLALTRLRVGDVAQNRVYAGLDAVMAP